MLSKSFEQHGDHLSDHLELVPAYAHYNLAREAQENLARWLALVRSLKCHGLRCVQFSKVSLYTGITKQYYQCNKHTADIVGVKRGRLPRSQHPWSGPAGQGSTRTRLAHRR